jgi:CubicO group peptidase (beta-lactamase class C family)
MNQPIQDRLKFLEAWLENQRAYHGNVGTSISIFSKTETLYANGFGYANIESKARANSNTRYRVASITKLFTTTAIMQLVEKGKLDINKTVKEYIPWFAFPSEKDLNLVTVKNLLNHTSGIPRESDNPYWTDFEFPTKEQAKESLTRQEQVLAKNTMWKYSNLGFAFLGEIISVVSGMPYEEYIENNILKPLALSSTSIKHLDTSHREMAIGYSRRLPNEEMKPVKIPDCKWISPAANLSSTVIDLTKFLQTFMKNEGAILRPSTVREMMNISVTNHNLTNGFGLGFMQINGPHGIEIGHNGGFQGYKSYAFFLKDYDLGAIVLTNSTDSVPLTIARQIYALLKNDLNSSTKITHDYKSISKFCGKYRSAWQDFLVSPIDGKLHLFTLPADDSFETKAEIYKDENNDFRLNSNLGGSTVGEKVSFILDSKGNVVKMRTGSNYADKIEEW